MCIEFKFIWRPSITEIIKRLEEGNTESLTVNFGKDCSAFATITHCICTSTCLFSSEGIIVLCHFLKNDLMPVIICKNDKHLLKLYNVIFSNMTGVLSHLRYLLLTQEGSNVPL